jgi:hypothetical protein
MSPFFISVLLTHGHSCNKNLHLFCVKKQKDKLVARLNTDLFFPFYFVLQVKTYFMNSDGADVIFHMIDHFIY